MTSLIDRLLSVPAYLVYLVVAAVVFAEDALFVGFVIPGETAAVIGGVAASLGHVDVVLVGVVVVASAIAGDTVGYEVGRHLGPRVLQLRVLHRHGEQLRRAQDFLARRGGAAVFLGRWVAFFRAVMPALAGTARMPYLRFLAWNAAGGLVWGVATVLVGYLAGSSYRAVEHTVGRAGGIAVAVVVVAALVVWRVRRHRQESRPGGDERSGGGDGSGAAPHAVDPPRGATAATGDGGSDG